jgi:hypothetical protein
LDADTVPALGFAACELDSGIAAAAMATARDRTNLLARLVGRPLVCNNVTLLGVDLSDEKTSGDCSGEFRHRKSVTATQFSD